MKLQEYKRKRKFPATPEPSGGKRKPGSLRFYVQKHEASHLHYDFRLELDGVLKSWAIPKGPSLDPEQKRLAVMVEDHPLDYGEFEGSIPAGNYGAGVVTVWDKGTYFTLGNAALSQEKKVLRQGLEKGHLKLTLSGEKLKGGFNLVRLKDGKNWILIKEKDEYASRGEVASESPHQPLPRKISPMLAKRIEKPFDRVGWLFEIKWDGYRAIAEISKRGIKLYSRKGLDFTKTFPIIIKGLSIFKGTAVFDGEIVAFKDGRPDFHALQNYAGGTPIIYVIFDLLYLNGEDLRSSPLRERKERLKNLFQGSDNIMIAEFIEDSGRALYAEMKQRRLEGIMAKDGAGAYLDGIRSSSWLKIKNIETQEAVIIGYTAPRGGRKYIGSLVLGSYHDGKLKFIGHSGGGFTGEEIANLFKKLERIKIAKSPVAEKVPVNSPITWVRPKYVCEVSFSEWTPEGRLRHPIYQGLREDKEASEVTKEEVFSDTELGVDVKVTNREKIYWPKEKYTKGEVADYYQAVAEYILPYLKDRPQNLSRHPNGIAKPGFYHKDMNMKVPGFASTKKIWSEHNEAEINYLLCQNKETLLYMANLGCIEINPWNSRIQQIDRPDYMVIDLDPGKRKFEDVITVAKEIKKVLDLMCEDSYVKTSGKSGLHIFIPLGAAYTYEQIRPLALMIVKIVNGRLPELTTIERTPNKRGNKIYLDYLQNRRGQTIASAYSLRPVPGALVSTPLEWKEVRRGLDPKKFNIKTILPRLEKKGDLWQPILQTGIDLQGSLECLEKNLKDEI